MAIFHMSFQNISAGKMRSAVASASYRSGDKLFSDKEGNTYYYARDVKPEAFILTPKMPLIGQKIGKNYGMKLRRKIVNQTHGMQRI